ncbi:MAG: GNAT family N-acetyltransferase [Candidatus Omnitrophota bacterium]|nr:GNAT family N-acetyltransferase [Candidatus Omnitrophota bacterium]
MREFNRDRYLEIAGNVGVFTSAEIDVIIEILNVHEKSDGKEYVVFNYKEADIILGFIIFGRTPLTEFSWDIYWLVVDLGRQGKGIGGKLIRMCQDFILGNGDSAILKVETSTKKEFAHARNLYVKQNFKEAGRIPNFYKENDDLIIYYIALTSGSTMSRTI